MALKVAAVGIGAGPIPEPTAAGSMGKACPGAPPPAARAPRRETVAGILGMSPGPAVLVGKVRRVPALVMAAGWYRWP